MSIDLEQERLGQEKTLECIRRELDPNEWVTVLRTTSNRSQGCSIYSTLIPLDRIEYHRSHLEDYWPPSGLVFTSFDEDGQETSGIDRDGNENPYLIIDPNPGEIERKEIYQKFRFSQNLVYDAEKGEYFLKDLANNNEKVVVAIVEPNCVKIRFKELRSFLKSEDMYLMLRFGFSEYSEHSLAELGLRENEIKSDEVELPDGHLSWKYTYRETDIDGYQTECLLEARRLIGYAEIPRNKVGFIIGFDEYGNEIRCDPREPKGAMYQNPGWSSDPMFVHFDKKVLDKYYSDHHTYTVEDTFLICHDNEGKAKWILLIDDDHEDKVCVELSRFRLILDDETDYWYVYNIPPDGSVSDTYSKRYGQGGRTSSTRLEHLFRQRYNELQAVCDKYLDWQLVRPIGTRQSPVQYNISGIPSTIRYSGPDEHLLRCLRVPTSGNEVIFESLVSSLARVIIESLNVAGLKALFPKNQQKQFPDEHTIRWFKAAVDICDIKEAGNHLRFLEEFQNLRTTVSAHLRDSNPAKYKSSVAYFNLSRLGLRKGFSEILQRAVDCLEFFIRIVHRGELGDKKEISLLYDLNEYLHSLLKALFPSGTEDIFASETWIDEIDPETCHIANHLTTKVISKFEGSPLDFRNLCENLITSTNPNMPPSDIRNALTDIAKVFIWQAERSLRNAKNLLDKSQALNMPTSEIFEHPARSAAYCRKLVEYSQAIIDLDEISDCDWYLYYVAWYLSYASCYVLYAYEHVWHADGLDSVPVILDVISVVQDAAYAAEMVVNVDAIRETAKNLTQVANELSGDQ